MRVFQKDLYNWNKYYKKLATERCNYYSAIRKIRCIISCHVIGCHETSPNHRYLHQKLSSGKFRHSSGTIIRFAQIASSQQCGITNAPLFPRGSLLNQSSLSWHARLHAREVDDKRTDIAAAGKPVWLTRRKITQRTLLVKLGSYSLEQLNGQRGHFVRKKESFAGKCSLLTGLL